MRTQAVEDGMSEFDWEMAKWAMKANGRVLESRNIERVVRQRAFARRLLNEENGARGRR